MQENKHSLIIEQKKNITINGVESVAAFSEARIILRLLGGEKMQITGIGLKITGFSKNNGTFTAEGEICSLSYNGKSLAAKLFK